MFTGASTEGSYAGPERRRFVYFRTWNTEYHLRGDTCVAVRDPGTGELIEDHPALGRRLSGAIRLTPSGEVAKFVPRGEKADVGDVLFFTEGKMETELHTSPVREIGRPPKEVVALYSH